MDVSGFLGSNRILVTMVFLDKNRSVIFPAWIKKVKNMPPPGIELK